MIYACNPNQRDKILKYIRKIQGQTPISEFTICSYSGCNKKLSLIEGLAGAKCTKHISNNKVDLMDVLKFK